MYTSNKLPEIKKEAFTKARETLGLSVKDVSRLSCLSVRQIEQIENGESGSFYGPQVKVTAAKKVAGILKLKEEDAFEFGDASPKKKEEPQNSEPVLKETSPAVQQTITKESKSSKPLVTAQENVEKSNAAKNPQRKLYILFGVAAALVFSIINLRPLFFPEVVKEEIVVVEQTQAAAPADAPADPKSTPPANTPEPVAAVAPPAPVVAPSTECPPSDTAAVTYKPDAPKKAGDNVYLQSKTAQTICVVDASGKIQNKGLEPGVGASVYGKPPFKVLTSGTAQVDIYFQGVKVRLSNITSKNILLEPAEIIQPLAPTDSQFR